MERKGFTVKEEMASVDIGVGKGWMDMAARKDNGVREDTTQHKDSMGHRWKKEL